MNKKLFTFLGSPHTETLDKDLVWYAIRVDSILRIIDHNPTDGDNPNLRTEIIFFDERLDDCPIHVYTTGTVLDIALDINGFEK